MLAPLATFSSLGFYSIWWIVPIAIREIAVTSTRIVMMRQNRIVAAEFAGKLKATLQYVTIGFAFFALMFLDLGLRPIMGKILLNVTLFGLIVTNVVTIYSGLLFFRRLKNEKMV